MWLWMALASSVLLGFYDVSKKQALRRNDLYWILFAATGLSALFLCPFLGRGTLQQHLCMLCKGVLVSTSWVSGMIALKTIPLTTISPLKATRPMFVVLFSIILFGERLNLLQWLGVIVMLVSIWLLSRSSEKEGISFKRSSGMVAMWLSIFSGVASALFDKHIMSNLGMEPLFVQSWANVYITLILGLILAGKFLFGREKPATFRPDPAILLIAVFITAADALYFFALRDPDALLSVVSMVRRCSVIITFILGALLFKEKKIRPKAVSLALMIAGMALLMFGTI